MTEPPIYLDYNATTPVDPAVLEAMLPYLEYRKPQTGAIGNFGNPSEPNSPVCG